jgi:hypothetical protein
MYSMGQVLIYLRSLFPQMKLTWGVHPDNLGHHDFPGCSAAMEVRHQRRRISTVAALSVCRLQTSCLHPPNRRIRTRTYGDVTGTVGDRLPMSIFAAI